MEEYNIRESKYENTRHQEKKQGAFSPEIMPESESIEKENPEEKEDNEPDPLWPCQIGQPQ